MSLSLYALVSPSGVVIVETVTNDKSETWGRAFDFLAQNGVGNLLATNRDGIENEQNKGIKPAKSRYFERRFWKKWSQSVQYAKRWGWVVKEVEVFVKATK